MKWFVFIVLATAVACVSSAPDLGDIYDGGGGQILWGDGSAGSGNGGNFGDAGNGSVDAGPCDLDGAFQLNTTTNVFANVNDERDQAGASLSPDELTLYVDINGHFYIAHRTNTSEPFGKPEALVIDDGGFPRYAQPSVTADQKRLFFECGLPHRSHICTVGLDQGETDFRAPRVVTGLPRSSQADPRVYEGQGRLELWFSATNDETSYDGDDLYSVIANGDGPFAVHEHPELNDSDKADGMLVLDGTGRRAIFGSNRNTEVGDLFWASREDPNGTFTMHQHMAQLSTSTDEGPDWMSPDGCRLYFYSNRNGNYDLYLAERPKN
ncbi:hypothetical protein LZC95_28805 [Pendulispora brunnea]|uniref:Uncharacterized protein n=1 Tax=Pendulispora brunnea TaxID=2905690 RepID=A0ABZ2JVG7_9BACT